jgi:hypothetical protein
MRRSKILLSSLVLVLPACGSSKGTPAESPTKVAAVDEAKAETPQADGPAGESEGQAAASATTKIPTECAKKADDVCLPDQKFVKRLCAADYPSVALSMFANGSPWTRAFLKGKTEAWNASGGASDNVQLEFDEEVLVLVLRKAGKNQIQVGSGSGYDVMRWDGTCVSLEGPELTFSRPPAPKTSKVEFKSLDEKTKDALREDKKINDAFLSRRNECQAASMGTVSLKCIKADAKLSELIVAYVRGGGALPAPEKLP